MRPHEEIEIRDCPPVYVSISFWCDFDLFTIYYFPNCVKYVQHSTVFEGLNSYSVKTSFYDVHTWGGGVLRKWEEHGRYHRKP